VPAERELRDDCLKCGAPVRGAACAACGLAVDRGAAYLAARAGADPGLADEAPPAVEAAWRRAIEAWGEQARHDEVLRQVATHDAYAWAARRYRARGADAVAERALARLRRAAAATLLASATARAAPAATPYRAAWAVLGILVLVIVAGLLYASLGARRPSGRVVPAAPAGAPRALTPASP
jgi:hypothetical protein